MAEIIEKKRRHYSGLDADKATIPAGGKEVGDAYFATDKIKQYYWNGAAWKTGLGYEYVPRGVNGFDKQASDFTRDGNWHVDGLDLSSIIPVEAVAVVLGLQARATAANVEGQVIRNATSSYNRLIITSQVANITLPEVYVIMPCDADRLFDYRIFANMNSFYVTVVGWFI